MKNKVGISLIVLVITIIVIIIIAGAVVLSLNQNNPINSATEASFKNDMVSVQNRLNLYSTTQFANTKGNYDMTTMDGKISDYITDITKYDSDISVVDGKLVYTSSDQNKINWCWSIGIPAYVKNGLELWLDGYRAPVNVSGSYYWPDNSTNNNNAMMSNFSNVNGGATGSGYDALTKSYVIGGLNEYLIFNQPVKANGFTISILYEPQRINTSYDIIYSGTDNIDMQIYFDTYSKKLSTSIENDEKSVNLVLDNTTINKTYKIDLTFDTSTKRRIVYVNNVVMGDNIDSGSYILNDTQVVLGRVLNGYYTTKGKYKNVMVYNRVLTATEIKYNYEADKVRFGF